MFRRNILWVDKHFWFDHVPEERFVLVGSWIYFWPQGVRLEHGIIINVSNKAFMDGDAMFQRNILWVGDKIVLENRSGGTPYAENRHLIERWACKELLITHV